MDVVFTTSSLARFSVAPQEEHLARAFASIWAPEIKA